MIRIRGLEKNYGDLQVLQGVDVDIPKGSKYGLIGRSGAGKSTLLRCINGLEPYSAGSLQVEGIEIQDLSKGALRELRRDIGMIFQHFSLLNRLDVYENIALPLRCWKYEKRYIDQRVKELLELVELPQKMRARPSELSGGQKQRVAIARALTLSPKILLCDEATSALDPKTAQSTIELLEDINRQIGITLVVVTHQMTVLRSICEEISILESGRVAAKGKVEDLFRERPPALENLMGAAGSEVYAKASGAVLEIFFTPQTSQTPIISRLSRDLAIDCQVLGADIERIQEQSLGSLVVQIPFESAPAAGSYLTEAGFLWKRLEGGGQA